MGCYGPGSLGLCVVIIFSVGCRCVRVSTPRAKFGGLAFFVPPRCIELGFMTSLQLSVVRFDINWNCRRIIF
jgi:hypothetical protein